MPFLEKCAPRFVPTLRVSGKRISVELLKFVVMLIGSVENIMGGTSMESSTRRTGDTCI